MFEIMNKLQEGCLKIQDIFFKRKDIVNDKEIYRIMLFDKQNLEEYDDSDHGCQKSNTESEMNIYSNGCPKDSRIVINKFALFIQDKL